MSRSRVRNLTVVLTAGLLLVALALQPANALASSSEITRAEANANWTLGSVAGSASWGGCEYGGQIPSGSVISSGCSLQPYVTIGTSECSSDERGWPHSNDKLALAWPGPDGAGGGSASFDVSDVSLSGEAGQLACLTLLETYEARPYCQLYPEPGVACPMWILDVQNPVVLGEAPLTQDSTSAEKPPTIESESVSSITPTDATLEAEINLHEAAAGVYYQFQLVKDPSEYASEILCPPTLQPGYSGCVGPQGSGALPIGFLSGNTLQPSATSHASLNLADVGGALKPGTTYHYRVLAARAVQAEDTIQWEEPTVFGADQTFTTPLERPSIEGESTSNIANTDATLEAEINLQEAPAGAYYQFQLVKDPSEYASEILCPPTLQPGYSGCVGPQGTGALPIGYLPGNTLQPSAFSHASLDLASAGVTLQPATTYHYRVLVARRVQTEDTIEWEPPTVFGPDQTFMTSSESPGTTPLTVRGSSDVQSSSPTTPTSVSHRLRHRHRRHAGRHHRRSHRRHRLRARLGRASRVGPG